MRVTNKMLYSTAVRELGKNSERLFRIQEAIAPGKKIVRPSDDPSGVTRVTHSKSALHAIRQYGRNVEDAAVWVKTTESALYDVEGYLAEAKELAVRYANDTMDSSLREQATGEIDAIYDQILSVANRKYGSRYIFGGYQVDSEPFSSDGTYNGDSGSILYEIGSGLYLTVNTTGAEAFTDSDGGVDVFTILSDFKDALASNDSSGIQDAIEELETARQQVSEKNIDAGMKDWRLEAARSSLESMELNLTKLISENEDVDYSSVVAEFANQQTVYQASIASTAQLMNLNIMSFLK